MARLATGRAADNDTDNHLINKNLSMKVLNVDRG